MNLVILEDDSAFARILSRQLSQHGYCVTHIETTGDLVDTCQRILPEVILLDMNLGHDSSIPYIGQLRRYAT